MTPWPDPDHCRELLRRLAAGDALAPSDFADAVLNPLVEYLRHTNLTPDEHAVQTAAEEAVMSVIRKPAVYDPTRSDLPGFLRMAARGDLKNILNRERRHHRGQKSVELDERAGKCIESDAGDRPSFDDADVAAVLAELTDAERAVLDLMRSGERATEAFAAVAGLGDLPREEQQAEVKRIRDRIVKRLQRAKEPS